jgi:hypothetical protein
MAKQNLDINLDTPELRAQMMSLAGVLKAGLSDAIQESFDPERFKLVTNDIVNLTKETARFADKILDNQNKLKSGSAKILDIENQIFTAKKRQDNVNAALRRINEANLNLSREVSAAIKESVSLAKQEVKALEAQAVQARIVEERVGRTADLMKGITKIPFVGQFVKADEALTAMNKKAYETSSRLQIIAAGLEKSMNAFTDAAALKVFGLIVSTFKQTDTDAASLARSMNTTYQAGFKFRTELSDAALASGQIYATGAKYTQSLLSMNSALGTASSFDQKRIDSYTKLRDVAKFEPEVLDDLNNASLLNKKTLDDITKSRLAQINLVKIQTGRAINERQVLKDIANTSNSIKINFLGSDAALAKAATTARIMGTDLNKLDKTAASFMNFETSIRNQMEAELISGKELNLEKARYYALTNNTVGLQKELNGLNITADTFSKKNRIDREATAAALGMSSEEMSEMLMKQKALSSLGAKDMIQAQANFAAEVKRTSFAEAAANLGDEALARQFQQQSYQDKMTLLVEKMLSAFNMLDKILEPIVSAFTTMAEMLAKSEKVLKGIVYLAGILIAKKLFNVGAGLARGLGGGGGGALGGIGTKAGSPVISASGKQLYGAAATSALKSGSATVGAAAGGGGLLSGVGSFLSSPGGSIKAAVEAAGGPKGLLAKGLKGSVLNTLISGLMGYAEYKSLISNPVDESGRPLAKEELAKRAGKIALGTGGNILGGILGAAVGGPLGSMVGSFGGGYLAQKLGEAFPDMAQSVGEMIVPKLATGGLVTQGGLARVDTGEVYLGKNSLETMKLLVEEMRAVKQAILSTGNTTLVIDGQKLATSVARNVATGYGNLLNPGTVVR